VEQETIAPVARDWLRIVDGHCWQAATLAAAGWAVHGHQPRSTHAYLIHPQDPSAESAARMAGNFPLLRVDQFQSGVTPPPWFDLPLPLPEPGCRGPPEDALPN
jgi:hypothetical protein